MPSRPTPRASPFAAGEPAVVFTGAMDYWPNIDAVTWFAVKETMRKHALLDVTLETGRTHQIRVHLEAIGLPVSGDPVYGAAGDLGLERQFLHARRLAFTHPATAAKID